MNEFTETQDKNNPKEKDQLRNYKIDKHMSMGGCGRTSKCKRITDNVNHRKNHIQKQFVIKEINFPEIMDERERHKILKEVDILQKVKQPFIVKFINSFIENEKLWIIMDFAESKRNI